MGETTPDALLGETPVPALAPQDCAGSSAGDCVRLGLRRRYPLAQPLVEKGGSGSCSTWHLSNAKPNIDKGVGFPYVNPTYNFFASL